MVYPPCSSPRSARSYLRPVPASAAAETLFVCLRRRPPALAKPTLRAVLPRASYRRGGDVTLNDDSDELSRPLQNLFTTQRLTANS